MITLFKFVEVSNIEKDFPDYVLENADCFSDESFWIELFNKEKDIHIVINDGIEYMKFAIKFYKTILEDITNQELYTLYYLSLCKEFVNPRSYNEFLEYCNEGKYILSEGVKLKIYPELPTEFFISSMLCGNRNVHVDEKIKNVYYNYIETVYDSYIRKENNSVTLIKNYSSNDFNGLYNDLVWPEPIDFNHLDELLEKINPEILDESVYQLLCIIIESLNKNDLLTPLQENIRMIKEDYHNRDILCDTDYYGFYNIFNIQYIYELYYENNSEILNRISLTWI